MAVLNRLPERFINELGCGAAARLNAANPAMYGGKPDPGEGIYIAQVS